MRSQGTGKGVRVFLSLVLPSLMVLSAARPVRAELYLGGFGGVAVPLGVDFRETGPGSPTQVEDIKVDPSVAWGAKLGYWIDPLPSLGLEVKLDVYQANVPLQTVTGVALTQTDVGVAALGATLMLRIPVGESERYPGGQVQPYLGVGPGIFRVTLERGGEKVRDRVLGLQVVGGVTTFLQPNWAIFFEFKYHAFKPEFALAGGLTDKYTYRLGIITAGLTYHF